MIINEQQRDFLKDQIYKINDMDKQQLHKYAQDMYLAKESLEPSVFHWLLRAVDAKEAELLEIADVSPMAVLSDLRMGEV